MNDFATIPIQPLVKGEHRGPIRHVTRVPCVGEYLHFNDEDHTSDTVLQVLGVTHLAWSAERPDAIAEIHCKRVPAMTPDQVF